MSSIYFLSGDASSIIDTTTIWLYYQLLLSRNYHHIVTISFFWGKKASNGAEADNIFSVTCISTTRILMIYVNVQEYARAFMNFCAALNEKTLLLQKKLIGKTSFQMRACINKSANLYNRLEVFIFFIVQWRRNY